MASPNTSGSQPSEPLVQRNSTLRPTSPAATSVQNHVPDKDETIVTQTAVKSHANRDKWIEYAQWALTVLGIAATCIFGAWAPLSYKATLDGNSGNNAAQSSVAKAAFAANSQAREAASQQRAALDAMNSRIEAVGQLWLYNFCLDQTSYGPCETFTKDFPFSSLVTYLAATTSGSVPAGGGQTESGSPSSNPEAGSDHSGEGSNLAVPAILGIVFGALILTGFFLGLWLFRMRRRRDMCNLH